MPHCYKTSIRLLWTLPCQISHLSVQCMISMTLKIPKSIPSNLSISSCPVGSPTNCSHLWRSLHSLNMSLSCDILGTFLTHNGPIFASRTDCCYVLMVLILNGHCDESVTQFVCTEVRVVKQVWYLLPAVYTCINETIIFHGEAGLYFLHGVIGCSHWLQCIDSVAVRRHSTQ